MKSVIITGANGFLGSAFVERFYRDGYRIFALVKDGNEDISSIEGKCEIIFSELTDSALEEKLQAARGSVFYHFAWQGVNGADKANVFVQQNNITMALRCAELAKKLGCVKFLCAGTVAENAVKSLPHLTNVSGGMLYGAAKHSAHVLLETYCKTVGLDFVWMQFSNIYGPNNRTGNLIGYTVGCLNRGEAAMFGPAEQPYDFIYVDDLIEAAYRLGVMPTSRQCYFIGSGEPRILKEYLTEVGRLMGRSDLIRTGTRPDDGIVYDFGMFDISPLVSEVGSFVRTNFRDGILRTIGSREKS